MAKYSNVFTEASRRYNDFKTRGFIPKNAPYAYQDFVNEVTAENRGENYEGTYTASAYEDAYGVEVNYYDSDTFSDVVGDAFDGKVSYFGDSTYETVLAEYNEIVEKEAEEREREERKQQLIEEYKNKLLEIFSINDYMAMGSKYSHQIGFDPNDVYSVETLSELLTIARKANKSGAYFLYRNQNGRNRRRESDEVPAFESELLEEINIYIDEIQEVMELYFGA